MKLLLIAPLLATAAYASGIVRWAFESRGGKNLLEKQGLTRDTLKPGDEVVVTANPGLKPADHRGILRALQRTSDGFRWQDQKKKPRHS